MEGCNDILSKGEILGESETLGIDLSYPFFLSTYSIKIFLYS